MISDYIARPFVRVRDIMEVREMYEELTGVSVGPYYE